MGWGRGCGLTFDAESNLPITQSEWVVWSVEGDCWPSIWCWVQIIPITPGADPELLLGRGTNPGGGRLPNILVIFSENPYEIKEILVHRGARAGCAPLNPPTEPRVDGVGGGGGVDLTFQLFQLLLLSSKMTKSHIPYVSRRGLISLRTHFHLI